MTGPLWEMGSSFHLDLEPMCDQPWIPTNAILFGSGRQALQGLVQSGLGRRWTRLLVPTYYCHDVTAALQSVIPVELYPCGPFETLPPIKVRHDDLVVVVEYFGMESMIDVEGGTVILDRTHHPWSTHSYERVPDYWFASIRKSLPLPDGAVLCSTEDQRLDRLAPPNVPIHQSTANQVLAAMALKAAYLASGAVSKEAFLPSIGLLDLPSRRASRPAVPSVFTTRLAPYFDVEAIDAGRVANQEILASEVGQSAGLRITNTPSRTLIQFRTCETAEWARQQLIESNIFPAVLWPLPDRPEITDRQLEFSRTTLALHVDYRYCVDDIRQLAAVLNDLSGEIG